jgi:hypothetical protein
VNRLDDVVSKSSQSRHEECVEVEERCCVVPRCEQVSSKNGLHRVKVILLLLSQSLRPVLPLSSTEVQTWERNRIRPSWPESFSLSPSPSSKRKIEISTLGKRTKSRSEGYEVESLSHSKESRERRKGKRVCDELFLSWFLSSEW